MSQRAQAWWNLPPALKEKLKQERISGSYGGESSYSIGAAPYYWAQEYGEDKAMIRPQGFAQASWSAFIGRAGTTFNGLVRETLVI